MEDRSHKICLIGAGTSGLAAARHLSEAGIPFDCLERESDLGGNWNIDLPCSRIFESTHLVSSKTLTEYTDHPMPEEWAEFPHQSLILGYINSYADRFNLRDHIEFECGVHEVRRYDQGGWLVTLETGEQRLYSKLIIANGHNWDFHIPNHPGQFHGEILHSGHYKKPDILRNKRVLVVGGGNSGCDIAVESSHNASFTALSLRRGYHVIPKFFHGTPIDVCGNRLHWARLPLWLRRFLSKIVFFFLLGTRAGTGLPKPDHKLFESHPTVTSQLYYSLRHGDLKIRPDVDELCGDKVRFVDGSEEAFDMIIYATGYHLSFPFLDDFELNWDGQRPDFHLNIFHPREDDLFIIGMIQPDSGQWGLVDRQAKLVTRYLQSLDQQTEAGGRFQERKQAGTRKEPINYIRSKRHKVQVEYYSYRLELEREIRKLEKQLSKQSLTKASTASSAKASLSHA